MEFLKITPPNQVLCRFVEFQLLPSGYIARTYGPIEYRNQVLGASGPRGILVWNGRKAVTDAESVCGPGRAVLSGSWVQKNITDDETNEVIATKIKYCLHLVRPDRFFRDHAADLPMRAIAASLGIDERPYNRNQAFKLTRQSKK